MIGFVPRNRPTVIPLRTDVQRAAIVESVGRDRVIAAIATRLYQLRESGRPLQDAYRLSNTLARDWGNR